MRVVELKGGWTVCGWGLGRRVDEWMGGWWAVDGWMGGH